MGNFPYLEFQMKELLGKASTATRLLTAASFKEAVDTIKNKKPLLVIVDLQIPYSTDGSEYSCDFFAQDDDKSNAWRFGFKLADFILKEVPGIKIIFFSSSDRAIAAIREKYDSKFSIVAKKEKKAFDELCEIVKGILNAKQ
jgi:DNA-binding NarL/FixJ family response regulator